MRGEFEGIKGGRIHEETQSSFKSSGNENLKYHQEKFGEKLEESCPVIRYMVMIGLKNLFA